MYTTAAKHKTIINESQLQILLEKHINFEKLDQEFKYQNN